MVPKWFSTEEFALSLINIGPKVVASLKVYVYYFIIQDVHPFLV